MEDTQRRILKNMVSEAQAEVFNNLFACTEEAWREVQPILSALDTITRQEAVEAIRVVFREKLERLE